MQWINFVHLYQPANIESETLRKATELSYERILRALEEHPDLKLTANIAGSLLERWTTDLGRTDLIARFKVVIKRGQLELVGSSAYHALLPLVSQKEIIAQIKEQERLLSEHFNVRQPKGFFLPEMAYSPEVAKIIKKLGYEWIIVDEITVAGQLGQVADQVVADKNSGLKVIVRNRRISESYVPDTLKEMLSSEPGQAVITATDAELYGLHHLDQSGEFEKIIESPALETQTISSFLGSKRNPRTAKLIASNWQSTESQLSGGQPFALWQGQKNAIQADLWKLADLAQALYYQNPKDKNSWWSRWHLWRGLASCSWWWASSHDFRQVFGPLAWSPDEIEKGVQELIRSIRSLEQSTDRETKVRAEKLAQKIRTNIWLKHWQK